MQFTVYTFYHITLLVSRHFPFAQFDIVLLPGCYPHPLPLVGYYVGYLLDRLLNSYDVPDCAIWMDLFCTPPTFYLGFIYLVITGLFPQLLRTDLRVVVLIDLLQRVCTAGCPVCSRPFTFYVTHNHH